MGHASAEMEAKEGSASAAETMSDRYDRVEIERGLRREWSKKAGLGFEIPSKNAAAILCSSQAVAQQIAVIGPNGPKWTETPNVQVAATV